MYFVARLAIVWDRCSRVVLLPLISLLRALIILIILNEIKSAIVTDKMLRKKLVAGRKE